MIDMDRMVPAEAEAEAEIEDEAEAEVGAEAEAEIGEEKKKKEIGKELEELEQVLEQVLASGLLMAVEKHINIAKIQPNPKLTKNARLNVLDKKPCI